MEGGHVEEGRGRRRIDLQFFGLRLSLVERLFPTFHLFLIPLDGRLNFGREYRGLWIGADGGSGRLLKRAASVSKAFQKAMMSCWGGGVGAACDGKVFEEEGAGGCLPEKHEAVVAEEGK